MYIDAGHPEIRALMQQWEASSSRPLRQRLRLGVELRFQLVKVLVRLIQPWQGQPILIVHQFLTKRPLKLSFGIEKVTQGIGQAVVAELTSEVKLIMRRVEGEYELQHRQTDYGMRFFLPVAWRIVLYTEPAATIHQLKNFAFDRRERDRGPGASTSDQTLVDISDLSDHLFRLSDSPTGLDWATTITFFLGWDTVKLWLSQYASPEVFQKIEAIYATH